MVTSADKPLRILCTGDLHLGRRPSRVPADRMLSVEAVWNATVDYATTHAVDALVLTGDVVDRANRYYESFGPLERGLGRLADEGIDTFAVAGNHDFDVFPRLVESLETERVHLLGRNGIWETATLERKGAEVLQFVGWSFPSEHVSESPLEELTLSSADVPTIGVLHADLDQPASHYAPVDREGLRSAPVAAWLLGHVHKPGLHDLGEGWALYPGSPQPLDPGEEGSHGPWLVEITSDGEANAHQLPLATLRYASIEVDLSEATDRADFEAAVPAAIQDALREPAQHEALRRCICRLQLVGRTPIHRKLDAFSAQVIAELEVPLSSNAVATVDTVRLDTRPTLDLETLAQGTDPPGVLAQLLLDLECGATDAHAALLRTTRQELNAVHRGNAYAPLRAHSPTSEVPTLDDARNLLIRQGMLMLDELLAQKTAHSDA